MWKYIESSLALTALIVSLSCFAGCSIGGGSSKPLHFYSLDSDAVTDTKSETIESSTDGVNLAVKTFKAPDLYQESPMIWRTGRHLQRFQFHHWSSPPPDLFRSFVADLIRGESGKTISWVSQTPGERVDVQFAVFGTIRKFHLARPAGEEVWKGVADVRLRLVRVAPSKDDSPIPGPSLSGKRSWAPMGSWRLQATATVEAPPGEQQTPSAMNALLDDWSEKLLENGRKIAREMRGEIEEELKKETDKNPGENNRTDEPSNN